jgi:hypothetical protein
MRVELHPSLIQERLIEDRRIPKELLAYNPIEQRNTGSL